MTSRHSTRRMGAARLRADARDGRCPAAGISTCRVRRARSLPPAEYLAQELLRDLDGRPGKARWPSAGLSRATRSPPDAPCIRPSRSRARCRRTMWARCSIAADRPTREPSAPARFAVGDRVRAQEHASRHAHAVAALCARTCRHDRARARLLMSSLTAMRTGAGENPQWLYTVRFDGARTMGPERGPDRESLGRCLGALSGAGMSPIAKRPQARGDRDSRASRGTSEGPVFHEPWEAHAFAMTLALHERGLFTWNEWAAALADGNQGGAGRRRSRHRRHLLSPLARRAGEDDREQRRRRPRDAGRAIATPGITPPIARRTASRSSSCLRISRRINRETCAR